VLDGIMRWITVDLALSARHAELAHRRIEALRLRYGLTGDAPRTYLDIAALTGAGGCQTGARRVARGGNVLPPALEAQPWSYLYAWAQTVAHVT